METDDLLATLIRLAPVVAIIAAWFNLRGRVDRVETKVDETNRRAVRMENALGMGDQQNGQYMRRAECKLHDGSLRTDVERVRTELVQVRAEVHELRDEMRNK